MGGAAIAQRTEYALPEGHDLAGVRRVPRHRGERHPDGQCGRILTNDILADSLLDQEALKLSRWTPCAT